MKGIWLALVVTIAVASGSIFVLSKRVGKQSDGTIVVSTGQRILPGTIAFSGRPMDLAVHPAGHLFAVATNREVFLANSSAILESTRRRLEAGVSYRGLAWSRDGSRLWISLSNGKVARFTFGDGLAFMAQPSLSIAEGAPRKDVVPGGLCFSPDGKTVFLVEANAGQVLEINADSGQILRRIEVGNIPFECRLSGDAKTLIVSNWGGREATEEEIEEGETDESDGVAVLVDKRGTSQPGTVSLIDLATGSRSDLNVGVHPCGIAVGGDRAWVANAGSDTVSEIDIQSKKVSATIRIAWNEKSLFGSMPNSLALSGRKLYMSNGGDNAICEVDTLSREVLGFRPAGYYPVAVQTTPDGREAYVCNTKGNGSIQRTSAGQPGGVHDFQGTVSVIDLTANIDDTTRKVVELNEWTKDPSRNPDLAVYKGKIKHVLYIIKENKTYDSVFGDISTGNGDPALCQFPEKATPNAHKIAREFTLFDNAYVVGTNSAEGHQWAIEGLANDYIERFYGGYSRSYPYEGSDPMAYSKGGFIWDSVLDAGKTVRNYGEFCNNRDIQILPKGTKWLDAWKDRESGAGKVTISSKIAIKRMQPFTHPSYPCWPISISDQYRADTFIKEYESLSAANKVPDLMLMILPTDHGAGTDPNYPTPSAMVADNDLALGRVVEAVSHSPQWNKTAIIVMQDDAQGALDHVDGHRTVMMVISPYTRRGYVDSNFYTQISVIRTIAAMLGTKPLTRFDATTQPLMDCFQNQPDFTPYAKVPNQIPLDQMNKPTQQTKGRERFFMEKSRELDFTGVDSADWYWLNRINWAATKGWDTPYPSSD
ncbi:MAG TPA: bifunctional YncE family protein/alkaline phosphatase family protein [Fimbriimonadaceae bacterium]|nr:bifunctional YncE family protein/alkaline phosphatase family protein [Fimbriimonadaceae bacterium]